MKITERQARNFWKKVEKTDGCWNWTACTTNGYGKVSLGAGTQFLAHRVSWLIAKGVWPTGVLMHTCDNAACVNPDHLRDTTQAENLSDMRAKGRAKFTQTLTVDQVREIRELKLRGHATAHIATVLSLPYLQVRKVIRGKTYKDVA